MHGNDRNHSTEPDAHRSSEIGISTFLAEHGITPTKQRVAIANHMFERNQHLSADVILERVNRDSTSTTVSKATVYNTLKLFVREGILREVAIDPQRVLFDTNIHSHHHVLDVDTGEIRDITPLEIDLSKFTDLNESEKIHSVDLVIKVRSTPQT